MDPNSLFDVQIKRLHEYKRQLLNVLHILYLWRRAKTHPNEFTVPRTFIFAAKASAGYTMAKQIISLICAVCDLVNSDPQTRDKLKAVFIEDYRVSLAELIIPAADISEQISVAGKEASGTGNMKLMINGAITLGTMDGANVEIHEQVGDDNIIIFGMNVDEVNMTKPNYKPINIYNSNYIVREAVDRMNRGINGEQFSEIANSLKNIDPYMALADFDAYQKAQAYASECYRDKLKWQKMSLANIANAGIFSADRSVEEYARYIWNLEK